MAEFGIVAPAGLSRVGELVAALLDEGGEARLPPLARRALLALAAELHTLNRRIEEAEAAILEWHKGDEASRRLAAVPGIGPITASAIVATAGDASRFVSARHFAAWLGLVPRQNSSGGKRRQGGTSKAGDGYVRRLLVLGATSLVRQAQKRNEPAFAWLRALLERRPARLASVAQANKTARIAWALLARGEGYRRPAAGMPMPA